MAQAQRSPQGFLTLGGNRILDFCNTFVIHGDQQEDRLQNRKSAEKFFKIFFLSKSSLTEKHYNTLIVFRHLLRNYFSSMIDGKGFSKARVALSDFIKTLSLVIDWSQETNSFSRLRVANEEDQFLEPLLLDFLEFSKKQDYNRVKFCANKNCSHLFYDGTKNKTRVWCSMKSCGNIMKARAFQARKRTK